MSNKLHNLLKVIFQIINSWQPSIKKNLEEMLEILYFLPKLNTLQYVLVQESFSYMIAAFKLLTW